MQHLKTVPPPLLLFCFGLLAMAVAMGFTPLAGRLATAAGAVAVPRNRDMHDAPVPRWGGLAIFLGFLFPVGAAVILLQSRINEFTLRQGAGLVVGGAIVSIVGAIDDRKELPPVPRLIGQITASIIAFMCGVQMNILTLPLVHHAFNTHWLSGPLTVFWLLMVMNAINWLDGLDGLAAGVCSIIAIFLAVVALGTHQVCLAMFCVALAGSTLGFLRFNYSPARIYMGGGAEFLGFILGAISVIGAFKQVTTFAILVPLLALAVPLIDSVHVVVMRWVSGSPIYQADRRHLHHKLVDLGLSKQQAVLLVYLMTLVLCLSAWGVFKSIEAPGRGKPASAVSYLPGPPAPSADADRP